MRVSLSRLALQALRYNVVGLALRIAVQDVPGADYYSESEVAVPMVLEPSEARGGFDDDWQGSVARRLSADSGPDGWASKCLA